jgi:hypothetical protein
MTPAKFEQPRERHEERTHELLVRWIRQDEYSTIEIKIDTEAMTATVLPVK